MPDVCAREDDLPSRPPGLGELLGEGRHARVFALGSDRVAKLFRASADPDRVHAEYEVTRAVREAGFPAWRVDEIVRFGDCSAIVGERVAGPSFRQALNEGRMRLDEALSRLEAVHLALAELRSVPQDVFRTDWSIEDYRWPIPDDPRALAREGVCHGDLNLKNLMLGPSGETVVIDWGSAFHGPLFVDAVRANRALEAALAKPDIRLRHRLLRKAAARRHRVSICRKMGWPQIAFTDRSQP